MTSPASFSLSALMLAVLSVGCASKPAPLAAPQAEVTATHFAGTSLTGPQASVPDLSADPWIVRARVIALAADAPPAESGFVSVGPAARLVIGPETGQVVAPTARLVYAALARTLDDDADIGALLGKPETRVLLGEVEDALVPGATASIDIVSADVPDRRAVHIQLYRRGTADGAYDLAITSDEAGSAREMIVVPRAIADGSRFALAIPMAFGRSAARSVVIDIRIDASPVDEDQAIVDAMREQVRASAAAIEATRSTAVPSPEEMAIARSLESLGSDAGGSPRGALAFIAEQTGAKLTAAVALVADDRLLQLIAGNVSTRFAGLPSRDRRSIAWLLDRTTIDAIGSINEADSPDALPPIQGALSIYAGEPGRQIDVLRSLAITASSSEDLYNRIVAENLILLEESAPGLRVRAYDWLTSAGRAPAGYDPLGTPQQRRAALERFREGATIEPTTVPTTNPS